MKAVLLTGIGGFKKLKFSQVETPKPKSNETLVKVLYCGLNHLDLLVRQGKRLGPKSFPHILGSEIVGIDIQTGDKVAVYPWTFCEICKMCKKGFENMCANGGTIGRTNFGGYAEYMVVPKRNLVKISAGLKDQEVCALVLAGITAYHLIERAGIKNGSNVLVTGATGGVGTSVVQILRSKKCKIICTTSHKNKTVLLKKLGAAYVVSVENMVSEIKKLYPQGLDYVIDLMGGSVWSNAVQLLSKNGTISFCATTLEEPGTLNIGSVFARQLNIFGSYGGTRKDLEAVLDLLKRDILKPVIDSIYSLNEIARAHQKLEEQKIFGKIILKISE